ncbi:GNAT family N-acetyltransferase [Brevibacillus parabrevis]|uniref:GNAT family N-acetyltransferase n=1 Tax=Brevibacillus parabrevis TaxID=54914 RepID=UPI0023800E78|nr:GNAT family N-acetyltransferase [Brevibacillus parabrevis]WDV94783.1 GNAT family N-acetyltransferase [Brevibacillus parabrevis]
MLVLKSMEQCTVAEAVLAYNRGFSGYFFDQSKTADTLIWKMGKEELSPTHSLVAFVNGDPAGIVLNGIWERDGQKVGWNGGTGVAPEHRRCGVGQALMEATLQIYREQGVQLAALVAIRENDRAIALYEKIGFAVCDQSIFLEQKAHDRKRSHPTSLKNVEASSTEEGVLSALQKEASPSYELLEGMPDDVYSLDFWTKPLWDIQWRTIENKQAVLVRDENKQVIGYALYRRIFENGKQTTALLFQCEARPERADREAIVRSALAHVFSPWDKELYRLTVNLPASNEMAIRILQRAGFDVMAEQVFMTRSLV